MEGVEPRSARVTRRQEIGSRPRRPRHTTTTAAAAGGGGVWGAAAVAAGGVSAGGEWSWFGGCCCVGEVNRGFGTKFLDLFQSQINNLDSASDQPPTTGKCIVRGTRGQVQCFECRSTQFGATDNTLYRPGTGNTSRSNIEVYSRATPRPAKPLVRQHLRTAMNKPH